MGTGACGINCSVCRLHVKGVCSTCGGGKSDEAVNKLVTQHRLFGGGCPVLQCALQRSIEYCLRDCDDFPCPKLSGGSYPYGQRFLEMQGRRRSRSSGFKCYSAWPASTPDFWQQFSKRSIKEICAFSPAILLDVNRFGLQCLDEPWHIDRTEKTISKVQGEFGGEWDRQIPFLILMYLALVHEAPVSGKLMTAIELYRGMTPFSGPHTLKTRYVESIFGRNPCLFHEAATQLGARRLDQADASARFYIFPKLLVDLLLWKANEEFPAKLTLLFDRNMPRFYPADAVALAVNLLLQRLVMVARK